MVNREAAEQRGETGQTASPEPKGQKGETTMATLGKAAASAETSETKIKPDDEGWMPFSLADEDMPNKKCCKSRDRMYAAFKEVKAAKAEFIGDIREAAYAINWQPTPKSLPADGVENILLFTFRRGPVYKIIPAAEETKGKKKPKKEKVSFAKSFAAAAKAQKE